MSLKKGSNLDSLVVRIENEHSKIFKRFYFSTIFRVTLFRKILFKIGNKTCTRKKFLKKICKGVVKKFIEFKKHSNIDSRVL